MATKVNATVVKVTNRASKGNPSVLPVPDSKPVASGTVTTSASSQQITTALVPSVDSAESYFWRIAVVGVDAWVTFGTNPTAVIGTGFLIPAGSSESFKAAPGEIPAVILDA